MAKFLFVYRGSGEAEAKMTPDEMQQMMQKWGAWIGEAMKKGWMLDPGDALTMEGRVVDARKVVTIRFRMGGKRFRHETDFDQRLDAGGMKCIENLVENYPTVNRMSGCIF